MRKQILMTTMIVACSVAPALAFFGPLPVVDISSNFHETVQIANQVQQIANEVAALKNEATNLQRIPTSYQNVQGEVAAIAATGQSVAAESRATVAAGNILSASPSEAAETARLNGLAGSADGAQAQAIVQNGYLAQQNNLLEQGNVLAAQGHLERAAEIRASAQAMVDSAAGMYQAATTTPPSFMQ